MNRLKSLRAIVLKSYDIRDSSRMVDIISLKEGRMSFVAKGARRDKSRFLNLTAPFSEAEFELIQGRKSLYIKDGRLLDSYAGLRKDIKRLTAASLASDALCRALPEGVGDDNYFFLYRAFLKSLSYAEEDYISHGLATFFFKLSAFSGFRPILSSCIFCHKNITKSAPSFYFLSQEGGMACQDHMGEGEGLNLNADEYSALCSYIARPLSDIINKYDFGRASAKRMAAICFSYWSIHSGFRLDQSYKMAGSLGLL